MKLFKGFTQIELLLSMGILMILIGILSTVFGQILDVQLESKALSSVDQNGRYIIARLTHDMQSADTIVLPAAPGDTSNTLQITIDSVDYIYSLANGNLQLDDGTNTDKLSSEAVSISDLTFTRVGNGDSNDTVRVGFTVITKIEQSSGSNSKSFQTTLSRN